MSKSYQLELEIRDDLQGRIEVFDQSIRSFEKRLRAVERRLSLEAPQTLKAGKTFSGISPDSFQEGNSVNLAAGSSVSPQGLSISPEAFFTLPENPLLSDSVTSLSEEDISTFAFGAVLPSSEASNGSMIFHDSSSEVSGASYRVRDISALFRASLKASILYRLLYLNFLILCTVTLSQRLKNWGMKSGNIKVQESVSEECIRKFESRIEAIENRDRFTLGSIKVPVEISGIAGSSVLFLTGFLIWSGRWDVIRSPYFSTGLAVIMAGAVLLKFYMVNRKQKSLTN